MESDTAKAMSGSVDKSGTAAVTRPLRISRPKSTTRSSQVSSVGGTSRTSQRASKTAIPAHWITSPNPKLDWRYSTSPEARARMRQYNKEYFRTRIWEPALRRDLLGSYMLATEHWRDENDARRSSYVMAEVERGDKDRREMMQKKVRIMTDKTDRQRPSVPATTSKEFKRYGDSNRATRDSVSRATPILKSAIRQTETARPSSRDQPRRPEANPHVKIALQKLENRAPPPVPLLRAPLVPTIPRPLATSTQRPGILKTPPSSGKVASTVQKPILKASKPVAKIQEKTKIIEEVLDIKREVHPQEQAIVIKYSSAPMVDAENIFADFGTNAKQPHYILRSKMVLELTKGFVPHAALAPKSGPQESDALEKHGAGCYAFESLLKAILQRKATTDVVVHATQPSTKADQATNSAAKGVA